MSWNNVIEETKRAVSYSLGNNSHNRACGNAIILSVVILANSDGTPILWDVKSVKPSPKTEALNILRALPKSEAIEILRAFLT